MPKILYLTLSLNKSELLNYKNKLENNVNYDLLYPSPDKICKIEPIDSEGDITSVFVNKSKVVLPTKVDNEGVVLFKHKTQYALDNLGYIEKNNIYIFNDTFQLNNINTDFLNRFKGYKPNSLCWWCCYPLDFGTIPIPLPIKYCERKQTFKCKGLFCSFECSMAYSFKFKEGSSLLINYLHKKMTGINMKDHVLKPAPPREILDNFGGVINITSFRQLVDLKTVYDLVEYPVIFTTSELREKSVQVLFKQENKDHIEDIDDSKTLSTTIDKKSPKKSKTSKSIRSMLKTKS